MDCVNCHNAIDEGKEKCPRCGWNQKNTPMPGVLVKECKHCKGTGQCRAKRTKGKKINEVHSCEYCVKKAEITGIKMNSFFPIVPCGYCEGKGVFTIDLKFQAPKGGDGKKQGQGGKQNGYRR